MVFPAPPSGWLVPLLSDANDAHIDDTGLPFSTQIFELQAAANALTSRIVEHIRHQSPNFPLGIMSSQVLVPSTHLTQL
jgi:hypothetical protein